MPALDSAEILELAIMMEKRGVEFYRKAASMAVLPETAKLFSELSAMEGEHARYFASLRAGLTTEERESVLFDSSGATMEYIKSVATANLLPADPAEALTGRETPEELLNYALAMEKDSVIFYLSMRELLPAQGRGREQVDGIIREEMRHIAVISRAKAAIKGRQ